MFIRLVLLLLIFISNSQALENCKWDNQKGIPCTTITKTPNTSVYSAEGINKKVFSKKQIIQSGATSAIDLLK